jgi:hypothetical protein
MLGREEESTKSWNRWLLAVFTDFVTSSSSRPSHRELRATRADCLLQPPIADFCELQLSRCIHRHYCAAYAYIVQRAYA